MAASTYLSPGVYVENVPSGARPIEAVGTSVAGFIGVAPSASAPTDILTWVNSWTDFVREFVATGPDSDPPASTPLAQAVYGFFQNGGTRCAVINVGERGTLLAEGGSRGGLALFEESDEISIIAAPGYTDATSHDLLLSHCENQRNRVAILDANSNVNSIDELVQVASVGTDESETRPGCRPRNSAEGYGAFYFPNIVVQDCLSAKSQPVSVSPSGHIAGIYARTDSIRGVHKAPANESIRGALDVSYRITKQVGRKWIFQQHSKCLSYALIKLKRNIAFEYFYSRIKVY